MDQGKRSGGPLSQEKGLTTVMQGLEPILRIPDWRMTTAELLYHMPDHPHVLQGLDGTHGTEDRKKRLRRGIDGPVRKVCVRRLNRVSAGETA